MEEETLSKNLKSSTEKKLSAPWIDLPDHISELILEKLPLPDYLCFAASCRNWRSIQKYRRLRFSPSQPPMSSPISCLILDNPGKDSPLHCYSPFNQSFYRLQPIFTPVRLFMFSCYGWILYVNEEQPYKFTLINPITNVKIKLPFISLPDFPVDGSSVMSAPPTNPNRTILLTQDEDDAFLCRLNDNLYRTNNDSDDCWFRFHLGFPTNGSITVSSSGRSYCLSVSDCFYVIDPVLPMPLVQIFDMDPAQIPRHQSTWFFVEFNGDVLLVVLLAEDRFVLRDDHIFIEDDFLGFQVFRPDYSEKMWPVGEGGSTW